MFLCSSANLVLQRLLPVCLAGPLLRRGTQFRRLGIFSLGVGINEISREWCNCMIDVNLYTETGVGDFSIDELSKKMKTVICHFKQMVMVFKKNWALAIEERFLAMQETHQS